MGSGFSRTYRRVGSGVRFEEPQIVGAAAAEPVTLVVDRHRDEAAVGKPRRVLLDADRQRVDAVSNHHARPAFGGLESLGEEQLPVERRSTIDVEGDLFRDHAVGQRVVPVAGLRAAFALHVGVGGLPVELRPVLVDEVGADLRGRARCGQGERCNSAKADRAESRIPTINHDHSPQLELEAESYH